MEKLKTISIKGIPFKACPVCGEQVKYLYRSRPHDFVTLEGMMRTRTCHYGCRNEHHYFHENPHVYPYKQFGKDIHALIAFLRYRCQLTLKEVKDSLEKQHDIRMDKETLRSIVLFYQVLNHGLIPKQKLAKMHKNGGIILSIDALKPQENQDPLYVVRDVHTETVLAAEFIHSASSDILTEFLSNLKIKLKELGLPVLGIISDKHRGQELALDNVFPDAPKQLCIYHFFKTATKEACNWDNDLVKNLRKEIRANHYVKEFKKKRSR